MNMHYDHEIEDPINGNIFLFSFFLSCVEFSNARNAWKWKKEMSWQVINGMLTNGKGDQMESDIEEYVLKKK